MKFASWKQFITTHPDTEELSKAATSIHKLIDPEDTVANNMERICASEGVVIVRNDAFSGIPHPVFYHHCIGIPIPGVTKRLVGLTGFASQAYPVVIESERLFAMTDDEIPTPSLQEFFSKADGGLAELMTIQPSDNVTHKIRLAAVIPPQMLPKLTARESTSAWELLFLAITTIKQLTPIVVADDEDGETETGADTGGDGGEAGAAAAAEAETDELDYAKDFMPLLTSLWSFTGSTEATKAITPPQKSVSSEGKIHKWCRDLHDKHINTQVNPTPVIPQPSNGDSSMLESIHRLAKSMEDRNNDKFGSNDETDDKDSKGWKKLEETFKKAILFASTTDGDSPAITPTPRLSTLLNAKNGAIVARSFSTWHNLDIVVQTGMASNIQKGSLLSDHSPFSVSNFSPFFTPPARAGFSALSNSELNCIDFASTNKNMSDKDIQKMVLAKPYVPNQPHLFIAQIRNWHAVLSDIFGPDALLTNNVNDVISHFSANELLYYNIFEAEPFFSVWFLNQIHFKCQRILHQCASAASVHDISFHQYNFEDELRSIGMNTVNARPPAWYTKLQSTDTTTGRSTNNPEASGGGSDGSGREKRRTVTNGTKDVKTKLKENERYSSLIHKQNLLKCKEAEVKLDGTAVCNNWHIRGWCTNLCARKATHQRLPNQTVEQYRTYVDKLRQAMADHRRTWNRNNNRGDGQSATPLVIPPTVPSTGEQN